MKNKFKIILALIITLPLTLATGCDNEFPDYYQEKVYNVENFEGVRLGEGFEVNIRQAGEFSVIAKGENRDLNNLQLEVLNGILTANYRPGSRNHKRTLIQISMPVLRRANLYGTSSSTITGFNDCRENLILRVSGASRVVTNSDWNYIDLQKDGNSEILFKRQAEDLEASIKKPSRLLGRVNFCEYDYIRTRWI